jgi:preprotein translocase subunit SecA
MVEDVITEVVAEVGDDKKSPDDWDWQRCEERMQELFNRKPVLEPAFKEQANLESLRGLLMETAAEANKAQEALNGADTQRQLEKIILLQMVDTHWKEHLLSMDHLKEGIGLRGYGQKNPLNEYKKEGFNLFMNMIETVKAQTISSLMRVRVVQEEEVARLEEERRQRQQQEMQLHQRRSDQGAKPAEPIKREGEKIGRNAPCPCGSGKKYKKCCGSA